MANNSVALIKDVSDTVMARINDMTDKKELALPEGYNAGTALRSAFLTLQDTKDRNGKPALEVCTQASIANSLLWMCIQGLQPEKKHCYFIVYGNQLQLFRSYFGTQAALKRAVPEVEDIVCDFIREGDQYEWGLSDIGERYILRVTSDPLTNYNKPIQFGFCNIFDKNHDLLASTIMSWADIEKSWKQSRNYGGTNSVHAKFPEEMAKRTLINRACKNLLNASNETSNSILVDAINKTTDSEYEVVPEGEKAKVEEEKKTFKERFGIKDSATEVKDNIPSAEQKEETFIPTDMPDMPEEEPTLEDIEKELF